MAHGLFGSSGIRGVVNEDLTPLLAVKVGLALGTHVHEGKVLVARDTRTSGLMLEEAIVSGLTASGAHVQLLGVQPTPVLAFLTMKLKADAGVMITASHNPPQYNGIKLFNREGLAFNEKMEESLEETVEAESFKFADWRSLGEAAFKDESPRYVEMLLQQVRLESRWHVVLDPGCGAAGQLAPKIFRKMECKVTAVNAQMDGFYPGRMPEPNMESLGYLGNIVKALGADVGIAYDGDADRVAFIDEEGCFADFDRVLAAYAAHVVEENGGGAVVTNVEASMSIEELVKSKGGTVVRTKVGDVYVAEALKASKAVFGGEPCGAWIHPSFHLCPDGILSSLLLLKALEKNGETLSEFIAKAPSYPILKEKFPCPNSLKHRIVERTAELLKIKFPDYRELSTIDGVRLALDGGWVLVRASGTEPLIRVSVEGRSETEAGAMMTGAREAVEKALGSFKL